MSITKTITEETVRHVARLARLELTDAEVRKYTQDLSRILAWIEELDTLNLDEIPVPPSTPEHSLFRQDEIQRRFQRDVLLNNAPESEDGFFVVPKIMADHNA